MDNDGAAPQQPVQAEPEAPEPQEPAEPTTPTQAEEPESAPSEPVNEGQDAPEYQEPEREEPDFDPLDAYGNYQQGQYQFQPAEDGSVDPYQVAQQIEQRLLQQIQFQRQETKAWERIDKKYGDKLTPARRELILNARIANAVSGKETRLTTLADKIMSEFTSAKSEGRAEAGISRKVQKAASLESATSNTGPAKDDEARYDRIMSGDKGATTDLLSEWLSSGKI